MEQAWGGGLDEPPPGKELDQALVREPARFLKAVEGFVGPKQAVRPACSPVGFGKRRKVQAGENLGRVLIKKGFEVGRFGVRGT